MLNENLSDYLLNENRKSKFKTLLNAGGAYITLTNTSKEPKDFDLGVSSFIETLHNIKDNLNEFVKNQSYEEKIWRDLGEKFLTNNAARTLVAGQTKPFFASLSKLVKWANTPLYESTPQDDYIELSEQAIDVTIYKLNKLLEEYKPLIKREGLTNVPENILFYGPPGTGKTREIQLKYLNGRSDDEKTFITFHQSYSYEEFIEGIKPKLGYSDKVIYTTSNLRNFAIYAFKYALDTLGPEQVLKNATEAVGNINGIQYKGIRLPTYFGSNNLIAKFDSPQTQDKLKSSNTLRYFDEDLGIDWMPYSYFTTQWGDFGKRALSFISLQNFIKQISEGELDVQKNDSNFILIQKLSHSAGISYEYANGAFYKACKQAAILAGFASLDDCITSSKEERVQKFQQALTEGKIFTFCIDEINRGNVASVFGELITLIETDKRLGGENELMVDLPYSKRQFGVPANLELIGSMNTADRSITLLDSALRRRFKFIEIGPDPLALEKIQLNDINLVRLLTTVNKRIQYFLGKDLCIGHAYFISSIDRKKPTKKALLNVILNKIIPLLEEYFYSDLSKVRLVLGDFNKEDEKLRFYVKDKYSDVSNLFRGYEDDFDEKDIYILNSNLSGLEEDDLPDELFKRIYE